jgi:uncharacterized membrane protein YozB (DUF420 family)
MHDILARPGFLGPYGTLGADLSYVLAVLFTSLFMLGWYRARNGQGQSHHVVTLWAMLTMLAYFTWYYLSRGLGVLAFEGKEGFGGSPALYSYVFSPLLTIHILIVAFGIVLAVYMIALGFRTSIRTPNNRVLRSGPPTTSSARFTLWTLAAALAASVLLFGLRALTKPPTMGLFIAWLTVCVTVGLLIVAVEWVVRRLYSDGERLHRALGNFTMVLYVVALFTSTATYVMLYVLWPPKIG